MSAEDFRNDAMKKIEASRVFSAPSFPHDPDDISQISNVLNLFPPRPERENVDITKLYGHAVIAGRIVLRRDAGKKLVFLTVQDRTGQMQVALNAKLIHAELLDHLRANISAWDVMAFSGDLSFSNSGEPTLWAYTAHWSCKSLRAAPDKVEGVTDKETRYRQRYLDLICDKDVMARFVQRAKIIADIRKLLNGRDYIEVDTPILQTVPNGASARPFQTHLNALDLDMRLRIATEIALKKLIVGGMERVFEIGRIFRNEGIDKSHNPEFTSIELYQAYASLDDMREIMEQLVGGVTVYYAEFMDLIREHTGCDPWDTNSLRQKLVLPKTVSDAEVLDRAFSAFVEPKLTQPTFVYHQPIELSPLCKAWPGDPRLAERFEFYMNGMEIANAYQELNDPIEQRRRLAEQFIVDEDFVAALEYGMPACAGMGIGIDRLVMAATNATSIRDVILFPLMRPG